jgi:DNA repair protein RadC
MDLKPREKLCASGPSALEDYELVSIILSRGNKNEDVFSLSRRLLGGFIKDEFIHEKKVENLQKTFSIGHVQACQLIACFELGKRFFGKNNSNRIIQSADEAYETVKNMQYLQKEHLRGLYLNSRNKIIHDEVITIGSLDANIVHPREIFRPAIEYGANTIILAHNHPSGDCRPSAADIEVNSKLQEIGSLLQIPLVDHLVIGWNNYSSLNKFNLRRSSHPEPEHPGPREELLKD